MKINLWKSIQVFPSYNELYQLAKKYYNNTLRICFIDKELDIFYCSDFNFQDNIVYIETYQLFKHPNTKDVLLEYEAPPHFLSLSKYNFSKRFKHEFIKTHAQFSKFCYISELYTFLIKSIN